MYNLPSSSAYSQTIIGDDYAFIFERYGVGVIGLDACHKMAMLKLSNNIEAIAARIQLESIGVGFRSYPLNADTDASGGVDIAYLLPTALKTSEQNLIDYSQYIKGEALKEMNRHSLLAQSKRYVPERVMD